MLPELRFFVACWNRVPGTPAYDYRLGDIKTVIFPKQNQHYPLRQEVCFFALLTGARGRYEFGIRQRCGVGPSAYVSWEITAGTIDLGKDPLTVRSLPVRAVFQFPQPGQYEFMLVCDGVELSPSHYLEARV